MTPSDRKHITIRYVQVPLSFDEEEQAHGTTLVAVPLETDVQIHDVNQIGSSFIATLSLVSHVAMSLEELDEMQEQMDAAEAKELAEAEGVKPTDNGGIIATPTVSLEQHRQNRAAKNKPKSKAKRTPVPPVSG